MTPRINRKRKRVLLLCDVEYGPGGVKVQKAIITTFSDKGAMIKSNTGVYDKGTRIKLVMEKDLSRYEAIGVVAWSKQVEPELMPYVEYGMGVEFTSVDDGVEHLYADMIEGEDKEGKDVLL